VSDGCTPAKALSSLGAPCELNVPALPTKGLPAPVHAFPLLPPDCSVECVSQEHGIGAPPRHTPAAQQIPPCPARRAADCAPTATGRRCCFC
jgi:hypothetical protein